MATTPNAQLKLRQTKLFTGSRYAVQAFTLDPLPSKLANCFVVQPAAGVDAERLLRVATLADLSDTGIPVNPLNRWTDASVNLSSAQAGDVLRITAPPGEWDPALPATVDFVVSGVSGTDCILTEPFWWKGSASLSWTLLRAGASVATGTAGSPLRQDTGAGTYKTDRWTGVYDAPSDALDHQIAVQAYVKTLVDSASMDPAEYLAYAPGNPIDTTFEG